MTLDEMIYEVWEEVRRNIVDDDELDKRLIAKLINDQRTTWVENNLNKGESFGRYSQSLGTITLEVSPASFDEATELGQAMLVSVETIPVPIYINGKPLFSVSPIVISGVYFKYADPQTFWALGNGRFNARQIFWTYQNDKLMFIAKPSVGFQTLQNIHVELVAEDPTTVTGFNWSTTNYPINSRTWTYMKDYVVNALLKKTWAVEDRVNNSTNIDIPLTQPKNNKTSALQTVLDELA